MPTQPNTPYNPLYAYYANYGRQDSAYPQRPSTPAYPSTIQSPIQRGAGIASYAEALRKLGRLFAAEGTASTASTGVTGIGPVASGSEYSAMLNPGTPGYVPAAVIAQTLLSGKAGYDMLKGKAKKIDRLTWDDIKGDIPGTIGRVGLGIATGGLSELANSVLNKKSTKQYQKERKDALIKKGVTGYKEFAEGAEADRAAFEQRFAGRIRPGKSGHWVRTDYSPDFVGFDTDGNYINNKYAQTGDLKDLTAYDVWGSEGVFSTFGDDWLGSLDSVQRRDISQALLDAGKFRQDKGDIIIHSKDQEDAREIARQVLMGEVTPSAAPDTTPQAPSVASEPQPVISTFKPVAPSDSGITKEVEEPERKMSYEDALKLIRKAL